MPNPPADCGRNDATTVHRNGVDHRKAVTSISPATMRLVRFMAPPHVPLPRQGERLGEGGARAFDAPSPRLSPWRGRGEELSQLAAWAPRSMVLSDTTDRASRNATER